jgi:hypothetical protein
LNFVFTQLGIVGGEKKECKDPGLEWLYWRLMTKEEKEEKDAKRKAHRKRLEKRCYEPMAWVAVMRDGICIEDCDLRNPVAIRFI